MRSKTKFALPAVAAVISGLGLSTGVAEAEVESRRSGCLWAGTSHSQGAEVIAGGWAFACTADARGVPTWVPGGATSQAGTVPNPGAYTDPQGLFSPGARQPGTSYTDYCVGNQLVEGTNDVYQAVESGGLVFWKAAAPISDWNFDSNSPRPEPTWRSTSNCYRGSLL